MTNLTRAGFGTPLSRVDGPAKVTGQAQYAAEFQPEDMLHAHVHTARIAKGKITRIDVSRALAVEGVVDVLTHENRPKVAWFDLKYKDMTAPLRGSPFKALYDENVIFSGQPIALVVAETPEIARYASTLLDVDYKWAEFQTDLAQVLDQAFVPRIPRAGYHKPKSRGDGEQAFSDAPVQVSNRYHLSPEHHNPLEMFASTVIWEGDGHVTISDKTQGVKNSHWYICNAMGWDRDKVRILSPFVGGAFGSGLRPQYQLYLAALAAKKLERSVQVVMTRQEMFGHGYRPECYQTVSLGADREGHLKGIVNSAVTATSSIENYMETVVNWGSMVYRCPDAKLDYKIAKVDTATPCDMRAPGGATGMNLFEVAMDELAYACDIDPLELRLRNYTDREAMKDKPYTSKALHDCYERGAAKFGWDRRSHAPRSMRDGHELIGWGMATGIWEAMMAPTSARARLSADGTLEVATATADMGPGTYTMMTQIAADTTGLPVEKITAKLGDSDLPFSPVQGGSMTAASAGTAVQKACDALLEELLEAARRIEDGPLAGVDLDEVGFGDGRIYLIDDTKIGMRFEEILAAAEMDSLEATELAKPGIINMMRKARNTHSAVFVEVRVDEDVGMARVTRVVNAVAAGRIINPKTARSQILGGVVFGIGMALEEETLADHRIGRWMNHNLAEYHVPVNADVPDIDVLFVEEQDDEVNPIGVKGVGEIGVVGTAAAIANALFHATGKRVRELPITIDKLL
ncbi:xanthine dehydrogenase family protein molybdopterin-binding subunit [Marivita sp.]|uniref:xanthine dehydrogenase family protein molybdopterin-binding subunit n=1 Tax=Marivita sp. TaxID=2003365 RepID=UPI0025C31F24|nr:xanthine dehydrogenase family protein molybdopterin-binding subunit [Marivita sp.]